MSKNMRVVATVLLLSVTLLFLASPLGAVKPPDSDYFAATYEVSPGVVLGFYDLYDHTKCWPANRSPAETIYMPRMGWPTYAGHQDHDNDYVRVFIYIDGEGTWRVSGQTQIVIGYENPETGERIEIVSTNILFHRTNPRVKNIRFPGELKSIPGQLQELFNPKREAVVLTASSELDRTPKGGIIGYAEFEKNSLPRPQSYLWWGGNDWDWSPPDYVEVREVGEGEAFTQVGGEENASQH